MHVDLSASRAEIDHAAAVQTILLRRIILWRLVLIVLPHQDHAVILMHMISARRRGGWNVILRSENIYNINTDSAISMMCECVWMCGCVCHLIRNVRANTFAIELPLVKWALDAVVNDLIIIHTQYCPAQYNMTQQSHHHRDDLIEENDHSINEEGVHLAANRHVGTKVNAVGIQAAHFPILSAEHSVMTSKRFDVLRSAMRNLIRISNALHKQTQKKILRKNTLDLMEPTGTSHWRISPCGDSS